MWSLLELLDKPIQLTVLDIGASGDEAKHYQTLVDAGAARVVGFEPNAQECAAQNRRFGPPHLFLPYFIGDGRPATYYETNQVVTGSLFRPNTPLLEKFQNLAEVTTPVAEHRVQTVRLDDIAEIDDVDYIKIDVQGGELSIFRNAPRVLDQAMLIETEVLFVECYIGVPMFSDIDAYLRGRNFQFHDFRGFGSRSFKPLENQSDVFGAFRQKIWADALYVRDWMSLDRLSVTKLEKMAVLMHDVVSSVDLTHLVLAELDRRAGRGLCDAYVRKICGVAFEVNA